ncbi:hypothetical protein M8818_001419 [Zalaria obscura]|uniref:Uncharacterized protein n=1 Tax=Zalaria obscura TaxID=2024903 RepID=A0ACC3SJQ3_9PEZI
MRNVAWGQHIVDKRQLLPRNPRLPPRPCAVRLGPVCQCIQIRLGCPALLLRPGLLGVVLSSPRLVSLRHHSPPQWGVGGPVVLYHNCWFVGVEEDGGAQRVGRGNHAAGQVVPLRNPMPMLPALRPHVPLLPRANLPGQLEAVPAGTPPPRPQPCLERRARSGVALVVQSAGGGGIAVRGFGCGGDCFLVGAGQD